MPLFFVLPLFLFSFTDGILKENPQICQIIKEIDKNAVRDMRKMSKHFGVSHKKTIFAYAKIGEEGPNASTTILHDRLTSFDLVKSGKFNPIEVKSSLVKPVLYPDEGRGLSYYICDFRYFQNLTRQV